ncbi:MAG: hypothetical protein K0R24_731 [Gammaproteobacteria bacterium]|nr:hypothetical protein [Gammaproteobacteria bacterium]
MTRSPALLGEEATVLDAAKKMKSVGCGILPVGNDNKHIKGVVSDRDIVIRAIAKNKELSEIPITEIMSKEVVFCEEEDFVRHAIYQMCKHNVRRVLIKDKTQALTGILSLGDILRRVEDKTVLGELFSEATPDEKASAA